MVSPKSDAIYIKQWIDDKTNKFMKALYTWQGDDDDFADDDTVDEGKFTFLPRNMPLCMS